MQGEVIFAVAHPKAFEQFLESKLTVCVLMDLQLGMLASLVKAAHEKGKKVLFHLDLLKGISGDEYGCEYACRNLGADGIISSKPRVIEAAKRMKKTAIFRLFLMDTKSLERGIALCESCQPDYVEILPGIACSILPTLAGRVSAKLMSGGLLRTPEDMKACFDAGACAVTISDMETVRKFFERFQ